MQRREFLAAGAAVGAGAVLARPGGLVDARVTGGGEPFRLDYAPHFGMFRHHAGDDPVDQLRFAADEGFRAWEDNGMASRSIEEQSRIGAEMERLGIRMGVFVANPGTAFGSASFVHNDPAMREKFVSDLKRAVDVAQRVGAKWMTVVMGDLDPRLEMGYQTANAIDMLRRGVDIFEPAGLVMVLEPLNPWRDHPGMFLSKAAQAFAICRAVNSPACKILYDVYHQQITEGNLIPNINASWSETAYFQVGDTPGRFEPGTGEINYRAIFAHLHGKGYDGVIGMEHGNSMPGKAGERAVIEAYRRCDSGLES